MSTFTQILDEKGLAIFAQAFVQQIKPGQVIFLKGGLGAGKTTFVRHCLRALGYQDAVKSPTYGLVESYDFPAYCIHHFDWYRLEPFTDLNPLGLQDYFSDSAILFIEWPERCMAPSLRPDFTLKLSLIESNPQLRQVTCCPAPNP